MISNLRYAARNGERVMIGGGEFGPSDLKLAADMMELSTVLLDFVQRRITEYVPTQATTDGWIYPDWYTEAKELLTKQVAA